ncbi:uncharacterized protein LOC127239895 [Andrographis paniculata]|uniref:uncharacterized protein LOC127239895 n=1 Tax=Andrographis paniculata TaxID=175694 RepID=UPI0021E95A19|nr:uncharacterized protein LOC127239895 [Andrographis paniculata]
MSSRRMVGFSPEAIYAKHRGVGADDADKIGEHKAERSSSVLKVWIFKIPRRSSFSPASLFRKVKGALPPLTTGHSPSPSPRRRCSRKVSSASLVRSQSYAETPARLDSQRAEAIEDCIEFLNSSSSSSSSLLQLQRSNSISSSC